MLGAAATLPFWASPYWLLLGLLFFLYISLGQAWNLLAGYSGLVSLGQQSFIGIGGYTVAVLSVYYGAPVWLGLPMAGLVAVFFAGIISSPLFRMKGSYFAVGSWVVSEVLAIVFSNWAYVGYGSGLFIKPAYTLSLQQLYYVGMFIAIACVSVVYLVLRSKLGLGLIAMRDNESAAEACGVDVFYCKLWSFLISAFITGIAAAVFYSHQVFIEPNKAFSIDWTVRLVFIVVIGGIGTVEGPLFGAAIMIAFQQVFADYHSVSLLFMGLSAIALMLIAPQGVAGLIRDNTGLDLFSLHRV